MDVIISIKSNSTLSQNDKCRLRVFIKTRMLSKLENLFENMVLSDAEYIEKIGIAGNLQIHAHIHNIQHYEPGYIKTMKASIINSIENISCASDENLRKMAEMIVNIDNDFIDYRT